MVSSEQIDLDAVLTRKLVISHAGRAVVIADQDADGAWTIHPADRALRKFAATEAPADASPDLVMDTAMAVARVVVPLLSLKPSNGASEVKDEVPAF